MSLRAKRRRHLWRKLVRGMLPATRCAPGVACGIAGCPTCSRCPDPATYARMVEEMAEVRGIRPG